jgi:hypothetical protein
MTPEVRHLGPISGRSIVLGSRIFARMVQSKMENQIRDPLVGSRAMMSDVWGSEMQRQCKRGALEGSCFVLVVSYGVDGTESTCVQVSSGCDSRAVEADSASLLPEISRPPSLTAQATSGPSPPIRVHKRPPRIKDAACTRFRGRRSSKWCELSHFFLSCNRFSSIFSRVDLYEGQSSLSRNISIVRSSPSHHGRRREHEWQRAYK